MIEACAIYARYSSDRQSPVSIEDQIRTCREDAGRREWTVIEDCIYSDAAISGTTADRPGLKRLLAALDERPCPFNVLLIHDTSRLSRDLEDSARISKRLKFAEVRVVYVTQGIDSANDRTDYSDFQRVMDSQYVKKLSIDTRRGMEGAFRRGTHTGGRCFGYRTVAIDDPSKRDQHGRPIISEVRLEVDEVQSSIVRRIFELYARGNSLKQIARLLNAEGVISPQPQKGRLSRSWCPSSLRVILRNERYRGVLTWGKTRKVQSPETGRRLQRPRPESEWVMREAPYLQIVSDDLWRRVHEQRELKKERYGFEDPERKAGLLRSRAVSSRYLLSGLCKCGVCGGNIAIVAGRGRNHRIQTYGCSMNANRGKSICTNSLRIRRDVLEREVLAQLQTKVWREEFINYAVEKFEAELEKALRSLQGDLAQLRTRKAELEREIKNLADAIAKNGCEATLMDHVTARQRELSEITNKLLDSEPGSIHFKVDEIRKFALAELADLRQLVSADVQDTLALKTELSKHIDAITLHPSGDWKVVAKGRWFLTGGHFPPSNGRWEYAGGQS